jgi:chaperone required for assembly of F1-ATPase
VREPAEIWTAAYVDEDFNTEQWGLDEEVAARRAVRLVDFEAATRILNAMKAG